MKIIKRANKNVIIYKWKLYLKIYELERFEEMIFVVRRVCLLKYTNTGIGYT